MLRVGEHVGEASGLDDLARVHHRHVIGQVGDDAEVVGDQQHRHVALTCEVTDEVEDLALHGDVERSGRLVGDQQLWFARECHGDDDALCHAAGELMGVRVDARRRVGDTDLAEQLDHTLASRGLAETEVVAQRLGYLSADGVGRVQRGERFLEDDPHLGAADPAELIERHPDEFLSIERDRGSRCKARVGHQAHQRQCGDRLARPRFADERQHFAPTDIQVDARHDVDVVAGSWSGEDHGEVAHRDERVRVRWAHRVLCGRGGLNIADADSAAARLPGERVTKTVAEHVEGNDGEEHHDPRRDRGPDGSVDARLRITQHPTPARLI